MKVFRSPIVALLGMMLLGCSLLLLNVGCDDNDAFFKPPIGEDPPDDCDTDEHGDDPDDPGDDPDDPGDDPDDPGDDPDDPGDDPDDPGDDPDDERPDPNDEDDE